MPRKPTPPTPEPQKKFYGIRFQSPGPAGDFRFKLPQQPDPATQGREVTLDEIVRETAEEAGQTEEFVWGMFQAAAKVFDNKNVGLGRSLSVEEAAFLLMLMQLGVELTVEDMQELIRQIRTGPVDRFFPLEEVSVH